MLYTALNILLMILGFGLLIFIHELGHFIAAKWAGIRTEAFAVGMGPVVVAWRKGVGLTAGSTHARVVRKTGKAAADLKDAELARHGLGETEYSLRWLPIGGFVRMLGQDDADPNAVSDDPRSYNMCPVGKRMVVVSAGVIMNIILAAVLFVGVFLAGVKFDAPIVGQVASMSPGAEAKALNAVDASIDEPGLQPGDEVTHIDGEEAETFADVQLSAAMSRPGIPVEFTVKRPGVEQPLQFRLSPERDPVQGLRSIGVMPAMSLQLPKRDREGMVQRVLEQAGLAQQGVTLGMRMDSVNGKSVGTAQEFQRILERAAGDPVETRWRDTAGEDTVKATIAARAEFQPLIYPDAADESRDTVQDIEEGLFGMVPLVEILFVSPDSANDGVLQRSDVVLRIGETPAPRMRKFREVILEHPPGPIAMTVLRDGERVELTATVSRRSLVDDAGMLNVIPGSAWGVPYAAQPLTEVAVYNDEQELVVRETPLAELDLFPGTQLAAVGDEAVHDWTSMRNAMQRLTREAYEAGEPATLSLQVIHPTPGAETETLQVALTSEQVESLHELGWRSPLPSVQFFEPLQVVRTAGGNPITALQMGAEETWKMMQLTYVTIDRLFRRTVGVKELRGPVGIVHIGVTIADKGLLYLIFLLAVISVNLAVINFLPLPIVDGGLFLFLVYEKFKGRPPSVAFQNAATILGLALIGTLFLVVTYNDIVRLVS